MSGHCGVKARFKRVEIVKYVMCVCLEDHETTDHVNWKYPRFSFQRNKLYRQLTSIEVDVEIPHVCESVILMLLAKKASIFVY
jgi:hypothetical protein